VSKACQLNLVIPADLKAIPVVSEGVMRIVREKGAAPGHETNVEVALCEALANAVKHGCGCNKDKQVQCAVAVEEDGEVVIIVRDPGPGFDPAAVPDPAATAAELRESGRGVFLINHFMDEVQYEDGGRTLRMRKRAARAS
jgi:serine/threonine-protein kinase RsbW